MAPETVRLRAETLTRKAKRHSGRRQYRKAAIALRERASLVGDAPSWVALGSMLLLARQNHEALRAFRQGLWLHRRAGAKGRARSVARLILQIDGHDHQARSLMGMGAP